MSILLKNINIVDVINNRIIDQATIAIEEEIIVGIFPKDQAVPSAKHDIIDLDGCFAIPGLIDLHTHLIWSAASDPVRTVEEEGIQVSLLRAAGNARKTLQTGITCVRDLGSNEDVTISLAKAISSGYIIGPRIVSAGCTIIMTGGHDPFWGREADGPTEMIKAVRRQVMKGAGVIKISATGGVYGQQDGEDVGIAELNCEEITAVCDEAHKFGLKVAAHAISEVGIWNCIKGGVDTIEHGHFLTVAAMEKMKKKGMVWVPTLYVYRQIAEGKDLPLYAVKKAKSIVDIHRKAFQTSLDTGLTIACGSDAGSPNTPHGSLIKELEYMEQYGCEPFEALKTATINGAQALGLEKELGSLEIGKVADIVILDKNPLDSISNVRRLRFVIKGGNIFKSERI